LFVLLLLGLAIGPITPGVRHPVSSWSVQIAHVIGLAMDSYSRDHNGAYPGGKSSTEVFQRLIDGGYVEDPSIFFRSAYQADGKLAATLKKLKPENVCWDVTIPVNSGSPDALPLIFFHGLPHRLSARWKCRASSRHEDGWHGGFLPLRRGGV
jgi:hypothetical protein